MKFYAYVVIALLVLGRNTMHGQDSSLDSVDITVGDPSLDTGGVSIVADTNAITGSGSPIVINTLGNIHIYNANLFGDPIDISSGQETEINNSSMLPITPSLMPITAGTSITMNYSTLGITMNQAIGDAGSNPGWTLWVLTANDEVSLSRLKLALIAETLPDFDPLTSYSWQVITASENLNISDNNISVDVSQFNNPTYGSFSTSITSSSVFLNYTPIPEPSSISLLGILPPLVFALKNRR